MSMNLNMQFQEELREFMVLGQKVSIRCDEIEYNQIILFITNLHAFGRYYWDTWKEVGMHHYTSSIYRKISQIQRFNRITLFLNF